MNSKTLLRAFSWNTIILLLFLSGCDPALVIQPSPSPSEPTSLEDVLITQPCLLPKKSETPSFGLPLTTASPMSTVQIYSGLTPDQNHLDHWQEIELALGTKLLGFSQEEGPVLCEWVLLAQTETELFLYSYCSGTEPIGTTLPSPPRVQIPTVILLGAAYEILGVELPGPGTQYAKDIRRLFPPEAVEIIFSDLIDYQLISEHLDWRIQHQEVPPIIVLSATPQP